MVATTNISVELAKLAAEKQNRPGVKGHIHLDTRRLTTTGAIDSASRLVFTRMSVDAIVPLILLSSTDHGDTGAIDLGLYRALPSKKVDGSDLAAADAVDVDAFGTAISISTAKVSQSTDVRFEASATLNNSGQRLWQLAGLSARPTTYNEFFIVGTLTAATTAAGSVVLNIFEQRE